MLAKVKRDLHPLLGTDFGQIYTLKKSGLWIQIRIDPHAILSCWIWIQKGKKLTHKKKKIKNFHVLKYWMFSFEG
jgi:hypothetical protein